jgi:hypothetical protein
MKTLKTGQTPSLDFKMKRPESHRMRAPPNLKGTTDVLRRWFFAEASEFT